jgi:hypothetical protein
VEAVCWSLSATTVAAAPTSATMCTSTSTSTSSAATDALVEPRAGSGGDGGDGGGRDGGDGGGRGGGQWRNHGPKFGCVPADRSEYQHQTLVVSLGKLVQTGRSTLKDGVSRHVLVATQLSFGELEAVAKAASTAYPGGSANIAAVDAAFVLTASSVPTRASKRRARDEDGVGDEEVDRQWQETIETATKKAAVSEKATRRLGLYVRATRGLRGTQGEEVHVGTAFRRETLGDTPQLVVATLLAGGVGMSVRSLAAAGQSLDGLVSIRVGGAPADRGVSAELAGLFMASSQHATEFGLTEMLLLTHWDV